MLYPSTISQKWHDCIIVMDFLLFLACLFIIDDLVKSYKNELLMHFTFKKVKKEIAKVKLSTYICTVHGRICSFEM